MNAVQFIEPQQRFTIRKDPVTIGTGVFTKIHPPRTEAEKDKKAMKIAMKVRTDFLLKIVGYFFMIFQGNNLFCDNDMAKHSAKVHSS